MNIGPTPPARLPSPPLPVRPCAAMGSSRGELARVSLSLVLVDNGVNVSSADVARGHPRRQQKGLARLARRPAAGRGRGRARGAGSVLRRRTLASGDLNSNSLLSRIKFQVSRGND
jgi:hypothetical protein